MNIGFVGLGKLGLPCAMAIEKKGHYVCGTDLDPNVKRILETKKLPYQEIWGQEYLNETNITFHDHIDDVVKESEIIFVPIQTPHLPKYEGTTRIPDDRVDFDYTALKKGMKSLSDAIDRNGEDKVVVIISTVLPGTMDRDIKPLLSDKVKVCYNPYFIAMGTTIDDFLYPEFILFGVDDEWAAKKAEEFYKTINNAPFYKTAIKNAELIKVGYNTFIGMKIVFANTLMEICHKIGADVDEVTDGIKMGNKRIISPLYFSGGCADGGSCHPRDNIALSWLSRELDLSYDWFDNLMKARENQTDWFTKLLSEEQDKTSLPIVLLGRAYKPGINLTVGSPTILLENLLKENGRTSVTYDPYIGDGVPALKKSLFFIGTKHEEFSSYKFPKGSVVIDPWRYIPDQRGVTVIRVGEGKK